MAVGLELTLHETEEALRLSGLGYDNSDDTDYAYMYILSAFHGCPIDECNVVLEKLNVKPLGTKPKNNLNIYISDFRELMRRHYAKE